MNIKCPDGRQELLLVCRQGCFYNKLLTKQPAYKHHNSANEKGYYRY